MEDDVGHDDGDEDVSYGSEHASWDKHDNGNAIKDAAGHDSASVDLHDVQYNDGDAVDINEYVVMNVTAGVSNWP